MSEQLHPEPTVDLSSNDAALDAGLAVGFGPDSGPPISPSVSVLQRLGTVEPVAPPVQLRDPDSGATSPIVLPFSEEMPSASSRSRYQFYGEIARGGMGAVLKGRDVDLGREIAVKVLLETHQGKPELLQRFVEEAQIAGQLQHPGVVPVYDFGQLPDCRPYFTMKLVKGQTLAKLLAGRAAPSEDQPRFLGIFLKICQTVGYAHARGVIHRDLKPSNVMVGSFGEVQVMDWGLAKVLQEGGVADERKEQEATVIRTARRGSGTSTGLGSQTVAGQVLGTPAYMAPEQARGEVDRLDERCDVFGLGAILCQILTGQPPYVGADSSAVFEKASRGERSEAFARLDRCGGDAELIDLAKRCLAAEPGERPHDAGTLAEELTAYLESVDARLRKAELDRAGAEAAAKAERRRRRAQLGLATAVVALVLAGGGAWTWNERAREERRARTAQQVNDALGRVALLRDQARSGSVRDPARWGEAAAALERAESALAGGEADSALKNLVGDTRREFDREAVEAAQDRAMLTRLEALHLKMFENQSSKQYWQRMDEIYATAFRDYGIDVDTLPVEEAAARIRDRRIVKDLAAALDYWANVRNKVRGFDHKGKFFPEVRALMTLSEQAEPTPWRLKMHAAQLGGNASELRAMAETADPREMPRPVLDLLVDLLFYFTRHGSEGDAERAAGLLRRAIEATPNDCTLYYQLGFSMILFTPPRTHEHVRYYTAALALRPDIARLHFALGNALTGEGILDEAMAHILQGLKLDPNDAHGHSSLAVCYQRQDKIDEAILALTRAVELEPDEPFYLNGLAADYVIKGENDRAEELLRKAVALDPRHPESNFNLGARLAARKELGEAARCYRVAIEAKPRFAQAYDNLAGVLEMQNQSEKALAVYREGLKQLPGDFQLLVNCGALLRRMKDDPAALELYEEVIRLHSDKRQGYFNKAMILITLKDSRGAVPLLRQCIHIEPKSAASHYNLGICLGDLGDVDGGILALRTAHDLDGTDAKTLSRLGLLLGRKKETAEALRVLARAVELDGNLVEALVNLGIALGEARRPAEAIPYLKKATELDPNDAKAYSNLGSALYNNGQPREAIAAFRVAVDLDGTDEKSLTGLARALQRGGEFKEALKYAETAKQHAQRAPGPPNDSARLVDECRQLVMLDELVPRLQKGEVKLREPEQLIAVARFSKDYKQFYLASARWFEEAFSARPELAEKGQRTPAACAAVLAADGQGFDAAKLSDEEKARWRGQALTWLQSDIRVLNSIVGQELTPEMQRQVNSVLHRFLESPELATVRNKDALGKLPNDEREAWQKLWAEVDALLKRAEGKK
jgi:serine/threonine-protein kinase